MSTGAALAAIYLTISAGTERQWQGTRRPRGRIRVLTPNSRSGTMPLGIRTRTRRRAIARAGCCRGRVPAFIGLAIASAALRRWLAGERWVKRLAVVIAVLMVIFAAVFGGLWWRLGAGPINLEMATPWLAAAIEDNIGHGNTVEVGGTQIERAGRIRIAVRIRDIIVRDRDHAIVASAPKAEVRLSGTALLMGRLRAESLNLVDAELAVRITPDGYVTVSAGDTAKPLATGVASKKEAGLAPTFPRQIPGAPPPGTAAPTPPAALSGPAATTADSAQSGLLAGLDWLDSLSLTGLDGQNLNEIGLKNGNLIVDDQQRGNKWTFDNVSLSLRRPSGGGVALSVGEDGANPWSLRVAVGPPANGVRSVDIRADKVSTTNILLALRLKDLTYSADLPLTGELKGELGRDGLPTYFRGKITAGAGNIIDSDTPDYPMAIDSAEMNVEWDSGRRVLVAPFKIISGQNRITLLAHLEPPNDSVTDWQMGFSGGTIVLAGDRRRTAADFQSHRHRLAFRHRQAARAADPGRHQQRRDRHRRYRQRRLFGGAAPDARFCRNADVGYPR